MRKMIKISTEMECLPRNAKGKCLCCDKSICYPKKYFEINISVDFGKGWEERCNKLKGCISFNCSGIGNNNDIKWNNQVIRFRFCTIKCLKIFFGNRTRPNKSMHRSRPL